MPRFAFADFHGKGEIRRDQDIPDLNPDGTVTASTIQEAFFKITGVYPTTGESAPDENNFLDHLGNPDIDCWWTIAKVGDDPIPRLADQIYS